MKLTTNALIQTAATSAQGITLATDAVAPEHRLWVVLALSALQTLGAILAHKYNPNGRPAAEPYTPAPRRRKAK